MNTKWNFILAGAVTLVSAAGIVGGEAAQGELRLVEAVTSLGASGGALTRPVRADVTAVSSAR